MEISAKLGLHQPVWDRAGLETAVSTIRGVEERSRRRGSAESSREGLDEGALFAAAALHRIRDWDPNAAGAFESKLGEVFAAMRARRGEILHYKAADRAMRALVRSGDLDGSAYREIKTSALGRADLDGDRTSISEGSGSLEVGLEAAGSGWSANQPLSHAEHAELRAREAEISRAHWRAARAATPSSGLANSFSRTGASWPSGLLWKPESDTDGNLVVLVPSGQGALADVSVLSPDGLSTIENGRFSGIGNGLRYHFRFDRPGSSFPPDSLLVLDYLDGTKTIFEIPRPSDRIE